ncbi:MAG: GNAT family N-acetyltransferase [Mycobacterium sp.]
MTIGVRPAQKNDVCPLSCVLARAFHDDPVMTWMLPDSASRARALPRMFATMTRHHYLAGGGAEVASRDGAIAGSTLWDPPGRWKTSRREALLMMPTLIWGFRSRIPLTRTVMEITTQNHPAEPHWYLMTIGTDPPVRGAGVGQALMHSRLERCDDDHAPAYLEASKPDLIPYYSRLGFEVTVEITLPNGPKLWPMWRNPR